MLGIIAKDLFQVLLIQKQRLNFIFQYLIFGLGFLLTKNIYGLFFSMLIWMPFMITPLLIQVTTERDDKSNYYKILLTMPITRADIISAKYILGIVFAFFNCLISLIGILIHIYVFKSIGLNEGLYIFFASLLLSLFSISINYLSYILLGSRGIFISGAMVVTILIGYYFNPTFLQIDKWIRLISLMKPMEFIGLGFLFSIFCLIISYIMSRFYFSKKEFS